MSLSTFVLRLGENLGQPMGDEIFTPSFSIHTVTLPNIGIPSSGNMLGDRQFLLARIWAILFLVVLSLKIFP